MMKISAWRVWGISVLCVLMCGGCGSQNVWMAEEDSDIPVRAPAARNAIRLVLTSGPALNVFHHLSGSCAVLVLQLGDRQLQQILRDEPQRLRVLFRDDSGENDKGLLKKDLVNMMPSRQRILLLDRVKGARFLLIAAGYYPGPSQENIIAVDIPAVIRKEGWWWSPVYRGELQPVSLDIHLGARGMTWFPSEIPEQQ
ncbi:type VI secretion lipoprotein TssJ [Salmonella enterica]|uniref:Type VI secretion lipoprotein TssJ n=1 Tax=Salmonella enterica TaxID=28901 RepID=A0A5U6SX88_SALER|nr:type VI secretion lipoprotein TssJ [Salmonella enterica]